MKFPNNQYITEGGYRFVLVTDNRHADVNWVFLPGGPGLGSEYLISLIQYLSMPGKSWRLDFPGDGSNTIDSNSNYSDWANSLVPSLSTLKRVILVSHSFSGMFCLTIPELENILQGFVVMDSSPNKHWRDQLPERAATMGIKEDDNYRLIRKGCSNDHTFKLQTQKSWYYFMGLQSEEQARQLLANLPYNYSSYHWAQEHFHPNYQATWVPQGVPTLILNGENDLLTPPSLFLNDSRFHRDNIHIKSIANASHFPWVEQQEAVKTEFDKFYEIFKS